MKPRDFLEIDTGTATTLLTCVGVATALVPSYMRVESVAIIIVFVPAVFRWPGYTRRKRSIVRKAKTFRNATCAVLVLLWLGGIVAPGLIRVYGPRMIEAGAAHELTVATLLAGDNRPMFWPVPKGLTGDDHLYVSEVRQNAMAAMRAMTVLDHVITRFSVFFEILGFVISGAAILIFMTAHGIVWLFEE